MFSFSPLANNKTGLIKTFIDRGCEINNTENGFKNSLNNFIFTHKHNCFPLHIINKAIRRYHDYNTNSNTTNLTTEQETNKQKMCYFKLPYIGYYSKLTEQRLKGLIKRFCTNLEIKLVISSYKIKKPFSALRILFLVNLSPLWFTTSLVQDMTLAILTKVLRHFFARWARGIYIET